MARVNVYIPDALAAEAKAADLNVSKLTQQALKTALKVARTSTWLDSLAELGTIRATHDDVLQAVGESKAELEESS